jgi:hypothetical protein
MEVTVVKLRHEGKKLSPAQLEAAPRMHGFMCIDYWHLKNGQEDRRVKELLLKAAEDATARPMLTLTDPEQTQLKGVDMVYTGTEKLDGVVYQQAWWVKLDVRPASNMSPYAYSGKRAMA